MAKQIAESVPRGVARESDVANEELAEFFAKHEPRECVRGWLQSTKAQRTQRAEVG